MKTLLYLYLAEFFVDRETFQAKGVEKIKAIILSIISSFPPPLPKNRDFVR